MISKRLILSIYYLSCKTLLLSIATAHSLFAQSGPDVKKFYEQDYAVAPNYLPGTSQEIKKYPAQIQDKQSNQSSLDKKSQAIKQDSKPTPQIQPEELAKKLSRTLAVVVSSENAQHVNQVLGDVVAYATSSPIRIRAVLHIGDYRNLSEDLVSTLEKLDIAVVGMVEPPEKTISSSPTWLIEYADGRYILEGVKDPSRFIDQEGEFHLPQAVTPAPTPKIEIKGL